ncbi:MAG: sulfatase-like hydrolase/transferase [Pirellulales bacterium]
MSAAHLTFMITGCFVATWLYADGLAHAAEQRKMNVLFLVADDLNSWLLEDPVRYPGKIVAPNLKRLARSGVNFTRAYTSSPVCSPSRTAFFSGVAPWKSGHYHNTPGVSSSHLLNDAVSLAGTFRNAGYTTLGYGKITHGQGNRT